MRRVSTRLFPLARLPFRLAAFSVVLALLVSAPEVAAQGMLTITDIRGRSVAVPRNSNRLLIDDGRYLLALSLIHPDPVSVVAAWPHDINRISQQTYERYVAKFPRLATIPRVASSAGTFSLEQAIAANPSVAIFTLGQGPTDAQLGQFAAAGIPVVFIDFFSQPFEHLERSLTILGQVTGRETQARDFITWRAARMQHIAARVKSAGQQPKVFLEAHAGISADCCNSPGKGNIGNYITFVGGHNIGADVLPGASGRISVEYVISQNPAVYILTGGPHLEKPGGYVVGPTFAVERSRQSLGRMTGRPGLSLLTAVANGRVHGLSHQLLNSPLDILAVEALASWIHPALFADLDPARTMSELNQKFLAVPLEGPLWTNFR